MTKKQIAKDLRHMARNMRAGETVGGRTWAAQLARAARLLATRRSR